MPREFILPDLGEGIAEAQIIKVMVKQGDKVEYDQYLMEVETDKAAVEIPSPFAGIATQVHVQEGQTVNVGDPIITFDDGNGVATPTSRPAAAKPAKEASAPKPAAVEKPSPSAKTTSPAAPAVRKLARQMGVDLDSIEGSGPGGRVTREDVEKIAGQAPSAADASPTLAPTPAAPLPPTAVQPVAIPEGTKDKDNWGPIVRVPFNQIRKTIAKQMAKSAFTIPHVTHCDEADITDLQRQREELNEVTGGNPRISVTAFVIRAVSAALRHNPIFNSSFDEEGGQTVYKEYVNIGVAVDTPRGLVVPVIRDVDRLGLAGIATELAAIAERVRTNKFAIEDLRGGTFTITNVGALGGTFSTPIINHPEVAILGLGRARKVPVIRDDELFESTALPINLSFDHRATDGANAARFTAEIIGYLQNPVRLLL